MPVATLPVVIQICTVEWSKQLRGAGGAVVRQDLCHRPPPPLPSSLFSMQSKPAARSPVHVQRLCFSEEKDFAPTAHESVEDFADTIFTAVKPLILRRQDPSTLHVEVQNIRSVLGAPRRSFVSKRVGLIAPGEVALIEFNGRLTSSMFFGGAWFYRHTRMWITHGVSPHPHMLLEHAPSVVWRDMHDLW